MNFFDTYRQRLQRINSEPMTPKLRIEVKNPVVAKGLNNYKRAIPDLKNPLLCANPYNDLLFLLLKTKPNLAIDVHARSVYQEYKDAFMSVILDEYGFNDISLLNDFKKISSAGDMIDHLIPSTAFSTFFYILDFERNSLANKSIELAGKPLTKTEVIHASWLTQRIIDYKFNEINDKAKFGSKDYLEADEIPF